MYAYHQILCIPNHTTKRISKNVQGRTKTFKRRSPKSTKNMKTHEHTEMMKNRFSSVEIEKDEIILTMKKAIEESDAKISELMSDDKLDIEALRKDYDAKFMTKNKELAALKRSTITGMVVNTDELFCMKRKVSSRNLTAVLDVTKCEGPSCNSTNVDMVKCIKCSKFVCEQCNNVPVTKLKNVMKKCSTIYFMCKLCDEADILTQGQEALSPPVIIVDDNQKVSTDSSSNTVSTFEKMILNKLQEIEERQNRFDETISMKFAENYSNLNTKITEVSQSYANTIKQNVAPNKQVQDFRKIIEETRNEELVQMKEREARAQNVIIHGLPEEANSLEGRVADNQTIKDFLTAIGVASEPRSIFRIGERNDARCRPIKLIMAINNEKDLVMSSLSKLKEAPDKFKRISVTDDYTAKEREEIRKMVVEAKSKTALEGEGKFVFKVRGTPKNGLVIRRFAASKPVTTT